jgi:predicted Zn-dependent peptidase
MAYNAPTKTNGTRDMPEQFHTKALPNGMMLLGQTMPAVASAAMTMLVRAGAAHDPPAAAGAAAVATEWRFRGAGDRDLRQLNDALDALGVQRSEAVLSDHVQLGAAQLGRNLHEVLAIYADVVRRPRLADATFEPSRELTAQDLAALEDEPMHKCMVALREKFYPAPLGRCPYGTPESLAALTPQGVREHVARCFGPGGCILAVAGAVDWPAVCDAVDELFGDWQPAAGGEVRPQPSAGGVTFVQKPSAQTHIALAQASVTPDSEHYYPARMAETILSGGLSGRLLAEVREKRGLVYAVACRYHSLKEHAGMFTYAGTRPEVAQQTLDVTVGELRRLADGIQPEELSRAKTQLKSALVMRGESTSARAGALADDWYHLGRLRALEEIAAKVDAVTREQVLDALAAASDRDFTALIIGPEPLDTAVCTEE